MRIYFIAPGDNCVNLIVRKIQKNKCAYCSTFIILQKVCCHFFFLVLNTMT